MEDDDFLEQLQRDRPLHNSWLKRDFLSPEECTYIYYGIEPFTHEEKMRLDWLYPYQEWEFIKDFDVTRLYDMLKTSYLIIDHQNEIPMTEFKKFLKDKEVILPSHLFIQAEILAPLTPDMCDETQLSVSQLRERFVRTYAAYFWKMAEGEDAKISAAKLAEHETFKNAISYVDLKDRDPKKLAEMFSDLSPRSHKKKKTSE